MSVPVKAKTASAFIEPPMVVGGALGSWLSNTSSGRMFGDYISTSVVPGGNAWPVLPVANAPTGSTFDLAMYVPTGGLAITGGTAK